MMRNILETAEVFLGERSGARRASLADEIASWVAAGGDVNMRDSGGDSALDFCSAEWLNKRERENAKELEAVLRRLGATEGEKNELCGT